MRNLSEHEIGAVSGGARGTITRGIAKLAKAAREALAYETARVASGHNPYTPPTYGTSYGMFPTNPDYQG